MECVWEEFCSVTDDVKLLNNIDKMVIYSIIYSRFVPWQILVSYQPVSGRKLVAGGPKA